MVRFVPAARMAGIALLLAFGLGACSAPTRGDGWRVDASGRRGLPDGRVQPNSSKILVQEISFARLVREQGQWTAFRETAAVDGVMFVPQPVNALAWLKDRADPAQGVTWQADRLFMACDGRVGASTGNWSLGNETGRYLTAWRNEETDPRKKERWRWTLDHGVAGPVAETQTDMIQSRIASCIGDARAAALAMGATLDTPEQPVSPGATGLHGSADGTLLWAWERRADGAITTRLFLWNGSDHEPVVEMAEPTPGAP